MGGWGGVEKEYEAYYRLMQSQILCFTDHSANCLEIFFSSLLLSQCDEHVVHSEINELQLSISLSFNGQKIF